MAYNFLNVKKIVSKIPYGSQAQCFQTEVENIHGLAPMRTSGKVPWSLYSL